MENTAKIYVGTYRKYNDGSIKGKWLDLSDYLDADEFYTACKELHKDESDPEFMFQDWENIPENFICESSLDEDFWEYQEAIENYFVVRQTGIASPSDRTEYFGRFSTEKEANEWIDDAVDTCLSNESFNEDDKTEFGVSKDEMDSKFRECYEIFEKGDSEIENEKIQSEWHAVSVNRADKTYKNEIRNKRKL